MQIITKPANPTAAEIKAIIDDKKKQLQTNQIVTK
jgi:hypothetical protein